MSGIYLKVTTELRNNFLQFSNLFKNESNMDVWPVIFQNFHHKNLIPFLRKLLEFFILHLNLHCHQNQSSAGVPEKLFQLL